MKVRLQKNVKNTVLKVLVVHLSSRNVNIFVISTFTASSRDVYKVYVKISDFLHERPLLSTKDGADYFGIEINQTAPTLILKTNKGFYALIVSGSRGKVDFEEISDILGCSTV